MPYETQKLLSNSFNYCSPKRSDYEGHVMKNDDERACSAPIMHCCRRKLAAILKTVREHGLIVFAFEQGLMGEKIRLFLWGKTGCLSCKLCVQWANFCARMISHGLIMDKFIIGLKQCSLLQLGKQLKILNIILWPVQSSLARKKERKKAYCFLYIIQFK